MKKVVFVLPRYGSSLGGGAEALARSLMLAWNSGKYITPPEQMEVWTTCALDHRTWENALPAGETIEDGVVVRRFPVSGRDLEKFLSAEFSMRDGWPLTIEQQLDWLQNSVNSAELYLEIEKQKAEVDLFVFAPYLFGTSFWGPLIAEGKSVILPCLHDEHYAYQPVFKSVFDSVEGIIFNAEAERELATTIFGALPANNVVGMGFETTESAAADISKFDLKPGEYFIYAGRKEGGKNVDLLTSWYNYDLPLVFIGSGELETDNPKARDLGFVSEEEKYTLIKEACGLIQLSQNESFSIVLMEAWLQGTPVIVHEGCPVTKEHVLESQGGLYCSSGEELTRCCELLATEPETRRNLGQSGLDYVKTKYSWPAVMGRLEELLKTLQQQKCPKPALMNSER